MITKVSPAAPKGARNFYAPIARFGFAVRATTRPTPRGKPKHFLMGAAGSEHVIREIKAHRQAFENVVEREITGAGCMVVRSGPGGGLGKFDVDQRSGTLVNFVERVVRDTRHDTEYLVRVCVTVCGESRQSTLMAADGDADRLLIWQEDAADAMPQHSKIWVRFLCVRYRGRPLDRLSMEDMRAFFDESRAIADKVAAGIIDPYRIALEAVVSEALGRKQARVAMTRVFSIDSFTVSLTDEDFPQEYRRIVMGPGLSAVPKSSIMRKSLDKLRAAFDSEATRVLPVEDLSFSRGVYWLDLHSDRASLIGVANSSRARPFDRPPSIDDMTMLKSAPSNIIGILSGSMVASAI